MYTISFSTVIVRRSNVLTYNFTRTGLYRARFTNEEIQNRLNIRINLYLLCTGGFQFIEPLCMPRYTECLYQLFRLSWPGLPPPSAANRFSFGLCFYFPFGAPTKNHSAPRSSASESFAFLPDRCVREVLTAFKSR